MRRFATGGISADLNLSEMDNIDDIAEFKDIPNSFVGIQKEKYPLIITFHKFIMMLDGTLGTSYFDRYREARASSNYKARDSGSVALQTCIRWNEVTFDRFNSFYWPRFNSEMTKNLDPKDVREFVGTMQKHWQEARKSFKSSAMKKTASAKKGVQKAVKKIKKAR